MKCLLFLNQLNYFQTIIFLLHHRIYQELHLKDHFSIVFYLSIDPVFLHPSRIFLFPLQQAGVTRAYFTCFTQNPFNFGNGCPKNQFTFSLLNFFKLFSNINNK